MHQGFWTQLPHPIVALSPMDGVTDQPYRYIQKKFGQPDLIFTEFTSAEGLSRNAVTLLNDFQYDETQRPVIAQIFGREPEAFRTTALMICYLGFDGIDINMGCPAKNVSQHGSGAALIRTPELAKEIIRAVQAGIQDWVDGKTLDDYPSLKAATKRIILERHEKLPEAYRQRRLLPVSVKTRIGYDEPIVEKWIPHLLETEPAAISLHGRTLKQLYSGQADWSAITRAAAIVHQTETLILGNGDILDAVQAFERIKESGVDGVLLGRATYGNPWALREIVAQRNARLGLSDSEVEPLSLSETLQITLEHARAFEHFRPSHGFLPMRKNLGWYIKGFPNASAYRTQLVLSNSAAEVEAILRTVAADNNIAFPEVNSVSFV